MNILKDLISFSETNDLQFIIIGGHVINAHGFSRHTADLNLLIPVKDKDVWISDLKKRDYQSSQDDSRFIRLRPKSLDNWPIDFMLVDEATFSKMYSSSVEMPLGDAKVQVVSLKHLAILKIHALKYFQENRFSKDFNDLLNILKSKQEALPKQELEEVCLKYASSELYDKIMRELSLGKKNVLKR